MARRSGWASGAAARQSGAFKWGTGINRVHSVNVGDEGRNYSVNQTAGGTHEPTTGFAEVPLEITDAYYYVGSQAENSPETGIPAEFDDALGDPPSPIFGYTDDSGASDRPDLGTSTEDFRGSTDLMRGRGWPSWGNYTNGIPGGTLIRDRNHGAEISKMPKKIPTETVTEGWRNKERAESGEMQAHVSDASQVFMQTSMTQRYQTRQGSQRGEGSQSIQEPASPIASRTASPKVKAWSGEQRHYDMAPRQAEQVVRPWWSRRAGTASSLLLHANEKMNVEPLVRNPPPDPYQGGDVQATADDVTDYGYASEDNLPYV